jgi:glycosyltransferase involved in cell wall biosynthesis
MTISVLMPIHNEDRDLLIEVLYNLTRGWHPDTLEVVLYNDGSTKPDSSFLSLHDLDFPQRIKNYLKIIESKEQYGVGYAFDRSFEASRGEIIVLAGADTFAQRSWLTDVKNAIKDNEIGCCASVGLNLGNYDIDDPKRVTRYGAKLFYKLTGQDYPLGFKQRDDPDFRDILEGRWASKQSDEPYEISCLMGAFYWCKREFYGRIHGFDTVKGQRFIGHQGWGKLEPYLSLKARVYGGKCIVYPDIRVGHVFHKFGDDDPPRAIREDLRFYNGLFIAHTMFEESFRDEIINFPNHSLNFGIAQSYIKKNWDKVQEVRQRNIREGKLISKNDVKNND